MNEPWRLRASCRTEPTESFFPEREGGRGTQLAAEAQAVCHTCPVRQQCLDYALSDAAIFGIWGGTTDQDRRRIRRERRRHVA